MMAFLRSPIVRVVRTTFRWFRIVNLLVVMLIVGSIVYLYGVGLPEFLKQPLLQKLREQGVVVTFSNARLGLGQSIVIENPSFGRVDQPLAPRLSARRTEVGFDVRDFIRSQWKVRWLRVSQGSLKLPLSESEPKALVLKDCELQLKFQSNNTVKLDYGRAMFHGVKIGLDGCITNFPALQRWPMFQRKGTPQNSHRKLERFATILESIKFTSAPELTLALTADGNDPDTLKGLLQFKAAGARTPWGVATNLKLTSDCAHLLDASEQPFTNLRLSASEIETQWARGKNIDLLIAAKRDVNSTNLLEAQLALQAVSVVASVPTAFPSERKSIRARSLRWDGSLTVSQVNWAFVNANGEVVASEAESDWGSADSVRAHIGASAASNALPQECPQPWALLEPYLVDFDADVRGLRSPKLKFEEASLSGCWRAPDLVVNKVHSKLYRGSLEASARLDVNSRLLQAEARSSFDPHGISQLLTAPGRKWLGQFAWTNPPLVEGKAKVVLPAWTNRHPDWRTEVLPTLDLAGKFRVGEGAYRKIPASSAESEFFYTNRVWCLPRLHAVRPGEELFLGYTGDEITRKYLFQIESRLFPKTIAPLLQDLKHREWLDQFQFTSPPEVRGEVSGTWRKKEQISIQGTVNATNLLCFGEKVDALRGTVGYTNRVLSVTAAQLSQGTQFLKVPLVEMDIDSKKVLCSNLLSTIDPKSPIRALGAKAPAILQQLEFGSPPTISLDGVISVSDPTTSQVRCDISGEKLRWDNLLVDEVSANLIWSDRELSLTNVNGRLYGSGKVNGWGVFAFQPQGGADCRFEISGSEIDLPMAVLGLSGKTNHLEGKVSFEAKLKGKSNDRRSWQGTGMAQLRDGLIWEIPIFGMFSPLLDLLVPGAGTSRAREADATFNVSDGMVCTDRLEMRAALFTLRYRGCIDADKNVNARVEAEMFKETRAVGRVLSLVLMPLSKIFEYQITGPANKPNVRPVYLPKFLISALRPFKTLKNMLPGGDNEDRLAPLEPPSNESWKR